MEEVIVLIKAGFPPIMGNIGILLAIAWLAFLFGGRYLELEGSRLLQAKIVLGIFFGIAASLVQLTPYELIPGVFLDARGIPIIYSGIIGGPLSAIITTVMGGLTRFLLGGTGVYSGLAFAFIFGICGLLGHYILKRLGKALPNLFFAALLGLFSTAFSSLATVLLPDYVRTDVIDTLWVQLLLTNIAGSALLAFFLQQVLIRETRKRRLEMFSFLVDQMQEAAYIADQSGRLQYVNQKASDMLGYTQAEFLSMVVGDIDKKESKPEHWAAAWEQIQSNGSIVFESTHLAKNGKEIPVEISGTPFEFRGSKYIAGIVRDITERLEKQRQILESSQRFEDLMTTIPDGFWVVSKEGYVLEVNQSYCEMSGYSREEMTNRFIGDIDAIMSDDHVEKTRQMILQKGSAVFESEHRRKDGSTWPVEVAVSLSHIQGGCIFAIIRDISERKEAIRKIEHMAFYDVLTGLPNRQLLADRLELAIVNSRRTNKLLGVCYLDLDGFKPVNDEYGHKMGDRLLARLSERLNQKMRAGDTLARLGGDEFILLLNNLDDIYQGEDIVSRLLTDIAQPFDLDGHRIAVSSSIGITMFPLDESDSDTLLRHADQAMYIAKKEGKNTYRFYDPIQDFNVHQHRQEIEEIKNAIANSEMELYFQPRINLKDGSLKSVEALIRWHHPTKGLLLPRDFLPRIENHPMATILDEWVLYSSLLNYENWKKQGFNIPISVNISPRTIQSDTFPEFIKSLSLQHSCIKEGYLELEVLENLAINDINHVSEIMNSCVDLGVNFSLDDFGTGFSSLAYFHHLPIQIVKIDKQFVTQMTLNHNAFDIVDSVIKIANALNRPVVAEGIENIDIAKALIDMNCQYGQGYDIARPMPTKDLLHWYSHWQHEKPWQNRLKQLTLL